MSISFPSLPDQVRLFINNLPPEGGKSQPGQFEMLFGKGNANDGDAQEYTKKYVGQKDPYAPEYQPDKVHECRQAARLMFPELNFFTEWPQRQRCQLQRL